jgi:oligoendopeptidase F
MKEDHRIPLRSELDRQNTWDLSKLYADDGAWKADLERYEKMAGGIPPFQGTLGKSAETLADYLDFARDFNILEERLGVYAELRQTEDEGDGAARTMTGRFMMAAAKAQAAGAWAIPEIQAIPDETIEAFLSRPRLEEYRIYLRKLLRYKPHILSGREERLLALHEEGEGIASDAFSVLTNVDMDFGSIDTPEGKRPLSHATWSVFMENPNRDLRRRAYETFYRGFDSHKTTLGVLYAGQVKQDVIRARIRNYPSARAAALSPIRSPKRSTITWWG